MNRMRLGLAAATATAAAVVACVLCAACGDDDTGGPADLTGLYQVTHHTLSDSSCTAEGTDLADPPYIRLTEEDYQGTRYFALRRCQSTDPADCDDLDFFNGTSFNIPFENGWRELKASAAYSISTSECMLSYGEGYGALEGNGIRVELRTWGEDDPAVSQDDCTPTLAREREKTMPCTGYEVMVGETVQP